MAKNLRRLILGNGESYVGPIERSSGGRKSTPPRSYDEARAVVKSSLSAALETFTQLPAAKRNGDDAVFCLRLHPDMTAKTYNPTALFNDAPQLRKVGSRNYRDAIDDVKRTSRVERLASKGGKALDGRLVFVRGSVGGFRSFLQGLERPESQVMKSVQDELRRVERFDALTPEERIFGFEEGWTAGRVELVFHPARLEPMQQMEFLFDLFDGLGISKERRNVADYGRGPTFVSCMITAEMRDALRDLNPLRAAHPLSFAGLTDLRAANASPAPRPPISGVKSTIKVGMFDGGVDPTLPHLAGYVEEDLALSINTPEEALGVAHGSAVAGVMLYGPLNGIQGTTRLPTPPVSVVSIRVLPTSNPADIDLYECIDVIEQAVPARPDINVFNLSFGPRGPIFDDTISRFTYALDALAVSRKVAFFVAVGNDGDVAGLERIQSPSDMVHGIGVGAYALSDSGPVAADYSCPGPGRECGKVKPDLAALGGSEERPMLVLGPKPGTRVPIWGTSFASPLAARMGALAAATFDRGSSLLARAQLIHGASHPAGRPDRKLGHGCLPNDVGDVLECGDYSVTVVFQGQIRPTQIRKLPIPLPYAERMTGRTSIDWTVIGLPPVDPSHVGDYTSCCIEDTFYPHARRIKFTNKATNEKRVLNLLEQQAEADALLTAGWKQSGIPESDSGNAYRDEQTRRAIDCKWEPVVRRRRSKELPSLHEPFLTLQAIGRNQAVDPFDYAVLVTIKSPGYAGDIYSDVRTRYPALIPIRLRAENELRVNLN